MDPRIFIRSVRTLRAVRVAAVPLPPGRVQVVPPDVDDIERAREVLQNLNGLDVVELLLEQPNLLDHLKIS